MKRTALLLLPLLTAAATPSSLQVTVANIAPAQGKLTLCLWNAPERFPDCSKGRPFRRLDVKVASGSAKLSFDDLPPGRYALSAALDVNGNGKIETNFIGIPTEPVGVSGPRQGFGRPGFAKAAFSVPSLGPVTITLGR